MNFLINKKRVFDTFILCSKIFLPCAKSDKMKLIDIKSRKWLILLIFVDLPVSSYKKRKVVQTLLLLEIQHINELIKNYQKRKNTHFNLSWNNDIVKFYSHASNWNVCFSHKCHLNNLFDQNFQEQTLLFSTSVFHTNFPRSAYFLNWVILLPLKYLHNISTCLWSYQNSRKVTSCNFIKVGRSISYLSL